MYDFTGEKHMLLPLDSLTAAMRGTIANMPPKSHGKKHWQADV